MGSRLVYFGGWDQEHHSNALSIFDPASGTWFASFSIRRC
jgi:hypothetical protein